MSEAPDCSFVICVEKGSLEYKALLLILTLRRNWGPWANLPLYAYSSRKGREPSDWLKAIYELYNVTPVYEVLNTDFIGYPLANKPLAMAHAEAVLRSEFLVFLDTDILCWLPPTHLSLPDGAALSMCVCGTKTVASSGPGDPYEPMWRSLYRLAGMTDEPPYVRTHLTGERVHSWWVSSVIPCRREAGVMSQWLDFFLRVAREDCFPPEAYYLREQISLDVVAAKMSQQFIELPISHNYPVQNFDHYTRKGLPPESAILWHYQPFLNKFFRSFAKRIDAAPSISGKIVEAETSIEMLWNRHPSLIGLDESQFQAWRRKLHIGPRIRRALGMAKPTDDRVMKW